jgi:hypothetical protein
VHTVYCVRIPESPSRKCRLYSFTMSAEDWILNQQNLVFQKIHAHTLKLTSGWPSDSFLLPSWCSWNFRILGLLTTFFHSSIVYVTRPMIPWSGSHCHTSWNIKGCHNLRQSHMGSQTLGEWFRQTHCRRKDQLTSGLPVLGNITCGPKKGGGTPYNHSVPRSWLVSLKMCGILRAQDIFRCW